MEPVLLEDFSFMEAYSLFEDANKPSKYFLRGILARVDAPNKNKRIYPRAVMEESIRESQPLIKQRALVGELDHPPSAKINVEKISHVITELALAEDGAILGEMEVISPKLKELIEAKIRLGSSTRGLGQVRPYSGPLGEGLVEVQPGYRMKAIDIVFDPSAQTFPEAVVEDTEEKNILIGSTLDFRRVWAEAFGG